MIISTTNGETFDTDRDLTAAERHILQKLFLWEAVVPSIQEFRKKKEEALHRGWNRSGPVAESHVLKRITLELERKIIQRLRTEDA